MYQSDLSSYMDPIVEPIILPKKKSKLTDPQLVDITNEKSRQKLIELCAYAEEKIVFKRNPGIGMGDIWCSVLSSYRFLMQEKHDCVGKDFTDNSDAKFSTVQRKSTTSNGRIIINGTRTKTGTLRICLASYNRLKMWNLVILNFLTMLGNFTKFKEINPELSKVIRHFFLGQVSMKLNLIKSFGN